MVPFATLWQIIKSCDPKNYCYVVVMLHHIVAIQNENSKLEINSYLKWVLHEKGYGVMLVSENSYLYSNSHTFHIIIVGEKVS